MKPWNMVAALRTGHQLTGEEREEAATYMECLSRIHAELGPEPTGLQSLLDFYTNVEGALSAAGLEPDE